MLCRAGMAFNGYVLLGSLSVIAYAANYASPPHLIRLPTPLMAVCPAVANIKEVLAEPRKAVWTQIV